MEYKIANPLPIHELGQRANQEDSLYPAEATLNEDTRVFILCDGMGGHDSGEVASSTVCDTMGAYFSDSPVGEMLTKEQFAKALSAAYDALDSKDSPDSVKKMGTTMTFLCFHTAGVTAAHIGDSRIYQIRPGESMPVFKTRDHSLVNDLIRLGEMSEEEAKTAKNRNVITRAIQPGQERRSKADISLLTDVRPGDWFYMCSDGMLEQMEDTEIISILTDSTKTDEEKRQILIDRTADNKDNHTAFMIHVLEVTGKPEQISSDMTDEVPVIAALDKDNETAETGDINTAMGMEENPKPSSTASQDARHPVQKKRPCRAVTIALAFVIIGISLWSVRKCSSSDTPTAIPSEQQQPASQSSNTPSMPHAQPVASAGSGQPVEPVEPAEPAEQEQTPADTAQHQDVAQYFSSKQDGFFY